MRRLRRTQAQGCRHIVLRRLARPEQCRAYQEDGCHGHRDGHKDGDQQCVQGGLAIDHRRNLAMAIDPTKLKSASSSAASK